MRRRALLGAVTAGTVGLAGCSFRWGPREAGDDTAPPTTERTTPDRTTNPTPDDDPATTDEPSTVEGVDDPVPPGDRRVVDATAGPRTFAVRPADVLYADRIRLGLSFLDRDVTGPPYLSVVVQNHRDHEVVADLEALPLLGEPLAFQSPDAPARSPEAVVAFVPTDANALARWTPEVERGPKGYWRLPDTDGDGEPYPERVRLDAGQRVRADCAVVGMPESAGRPPGVYESSASAGTVALTVWHTGRPGPTAPSRFGDRSVPPLLEDEDVGVTWYHEAGAETPVYVEPETERATLPARVRFTAVNHGREPADCGNWSLFKLVDGTFHGLDAPLETSECRGLVPGGREPYDLRAVDDEALPTRDQSVRTVGFLGGGTYAVVVGYGARTELSGALVDFEGPPVEVEPTDDVVAERDGATVSVRRTDLPEDVPTGTATLTRADSADRRLIAEQVTRPWNRAVRNTVPFLCDDVEEVVLETTTALVDRAVAVGSDTHRFSFRGRAYRFVGETSERN